MLMSSANDQRSHAESIFNLCRDHHPDTLALKLAHLLHSSPAVEIRAMAAILLRKQLTRDSSSSSSDASPSYLWPRLSQPTQDTLKSMLLASVQREEVKTTSKKLCDTVSEPASNLLPMASEAPTRRCTPDHPPYAWMVHNAIQDLDENGGSTESSISDYILANYHSLPWAHSKLLPYYLNKLVLAAEIIITSSSPVRYSLPPSNPNPPLPFRRRGARPLITAPIQNPKPQLPLVCEEQTEIKKRRLIIRLKNKKD